MSSKQAKKATESSAASKKKTPAMRKKASTSASAKKSARSGTAKKKLASRKTTGKKAASRRTTGKKAASRKAPAKKPSRKGALLQDTATGTETAVDTEPKSISWMSAQATSALKAVKANQAVKGQAVIAKNRKREDRQQIDDASLIEIAEGMPVDDAALIEFAAEDLQQEPVQKTVDKEHEAPPKDTAATADVAEQVAATEQKETPMAEIKPEESPATTPQETKTDTPPPPPPARQQKSHWPAFLAITAIAVILGYVFWPGVKEGTMLEALIEMVHTPDRPAAVTTAAPASEETGNTLSSTEMVTPDEPDTQSITAPPAVADDAWAPSNMPPQASPSTTVASPQPAAAADAPAPDTANAGQTLPEAEVSEQAEPAVVAQPASEPATPPATTASQAVAAPAAPATRAPAAPAGYRTQGYGYYPQSRQPAYPPQYYPQYR